MTTQQLLKNKAAKILNKRVSQIKKVTLQGGKFNVGATVHMSSGSMPWINIPVDVWNA